MELNPGFLHGPSINGWTYLLGCIYGWDESPQESLGEAMTLSKRTFELDPTDDPTHGGQPLTFFNGHYDTWCYLPPVSSSSITGYQRAQVSTLRERLLKLGAWVERSVRRIVVHLPDSAPWRSEWCRVARALGAAPT